MEDQVLCKTRLVFIEEVMFAKEAAQSTKYKGGNKCEVFAFVENILFD